MAPRVALAAIPESGRRALGLLVELAGADRPLWLVGGAVRQLLAAEPLGDLDVAVPSGALALGRRLADRLGATFVVLDESRGAGRIVGAEVELPVDLVDFRAPTLEDDLRARDFTVNALAVPLADVLRDGSAEVTDATGGVGDLGDRVVRVCGPTAIVDDPVRALRGVRLAMREGWRLEPGTEAAIRAGAPLLARVSAERVRDELVGILGEPRAAAGLRMLDRLGALTVLLPESAAMRATSQPLPHRFDVWEHSIRTVEGVDLLLSDLDALAPWGAALRAHLDEPLGGGLSRRETLRLAALLHDVAKPETRTEQGGRVRFFGHDAAGARPHRRHRRAPPAPPTGEPGPGAARGRAPAARCTWRRRGRSRGGRAFASSAISARTRPISCSSRWRTRPRSPAARPWRCGLRRAGRWCAS